MNKTVLIVDDSGYTRKTINSALTQAGYKVIGEAETGEAAIDLAIELEPDVITLDNILPDMIGLDVLKVIKEEDLSSKVILVSAVGQQSTIQDGLSLGADKYILKPFTPTDLVDAIENVSVA